MFPHQLGQKRTIFPLMLPVGRIFLQCSTQLGKVHGELTRMTHHPHISAEIDIHYKVAECEVNDKTKDVCKWCHIAYTLHGICAEVGKLRRFAQCESLIDIEADGLYQWPYNNK